ncbi:MAG: DUF1573 domain-containing protein [Bacteroidales bacterium]|nr:DUF1573 domain-containing protein [Bacteroidales bacterium]
MKRLFSLICILLSVEVLLASGQLTFTKTSHDFGTISEKDGDATVTFEFKNTGDAPILILRAASSCGCTVPEYPKKPIRPGESGEIKVTYHAKGRPGPFQKSVQIVDNTDSKTQVTIRGNVVSSTTPEDTYTNEMGAGLRSKTRSMNFFDVYPNRSNRTRTLQFYNESEEPIQLTFRGVSGNLYLEAHPQIIPPKQEGKVLITFLTSKSKDWGIHNEEFEVFVKGKESQMKNNVVSVSADIWEDFSKLSKKDRAQAGEIEVSDSNLDFGQSATENVVREITIRNTGKSKLTIRKVANDMPKVFRVRLANSVIKPGQSTTLTVTYNPAENKLGRLTHHLMIISNDPGNSRVIVNMSADK